MDIIKTLKADQMMLGGTAANVATVLSQLGFKLFFLAMEYKNRRGDWLKEEFSARRIQPIYFGGTIKEAPAVIEVLDSENESHRFYTTCPVCGRKINACMLPTEKQIDKINDKVLKDPDVFFFDRVSDGIRQIARLNHKGWNFYEPNSCRNYQTLLSNILLADIVKFSRDRIADSVAEKLVSDTAESNVKLLIVTMGKEGMRYRYRRETGQWSDWILVPPGNSGDFIDSSGAGDWLTAGILFYLIQEYPVCTVRFEVDKLQRIFADAQKLSVMKCSYIGAQGIFFDEKGIGRIEKEMAIKLKKLENRPFVMEQGCYFCKS